MHGSGGRIERPPFSLPTGLSEGRPDITALLNAREPHERLIREGALERRAAAEQVRADSLARARTAPTSPGGGSSSSPSGGSAASPARAGLSALGFVPPGMVASGTLNALAAGMAVPQGAQLEPNRHARPPTAVGMYPTRPRTLEGRRPDLQALRQHDLSRSERAASLALNQSGAWETAVGGWEGGGGGGGGGGGDGGLAAGWGAAGMHASSSTSGGEEGFGWDNGGGSGGGGRGSSSSGGGGGGNSPINLPPLNFPGSVQGGGSTAGGGGPRLVRVGVAVEDILAEQRVMTGISSSSSSSSGGGGSISGSGGRRPLPSPMHPRTPYGTIRAPAELEAAASRMPQFVRPSRSTFFAPTADEDYALTTQHPVAFRAAVKDLPAAAVQAVRDMLLDKAHLTVSNIHQRRPPYLDIGPGTTLRNITQREMLPAEFKGSLRKQAEDSMAPVKRRPFTLGATAPWNKGKYTISGMDTFDFIAKQSAVSYYVSDFTAPAPATMRPPSRGVTRFASNVPSMVERGEEMQRARETNKLLTRISQPHDHEDTVYTMSHLQERHLSKLPLDAPGDRLVPYANTPLLPPTPKAIPPVSQSSSYRVYGTPRL